MTAAQSGEHGNSPQGNAVAEFAESGGGVSEGHILPLRPGCHGASDRRCASGGLRLGTVSDVRNGRTLGLIQCGGCVTASGTEALVVFGEVGACRASADPAPSGGGRPPPSKVAPFHNSAVAPGTGQRYTYMYKARFSTTNTYP